jgi:glycosyltransferase involved in cell wall biosynthesis
MKINFNAPINPTGYGVASFGILKELSQKHDIAYFPKGQPVVYTQEDHDLVLKLIANQNNYDPASPTVKIWHQFDLAEHIGKGRYYAYPFFELDTILPLEKKHISTADTLFVSSQWAKDVILNNGLKIETHVVPLGVDTSIFKTELYKKTTPTTDKYIFLNIGKWEIRKGHDILASLFSKAFPKEKDVELWVLASEHTNNYSTPEQLNEWKQKYSGDSRIKISNGVETQYDIANIMSQASCGIFMSRAEGWNLELLECMAMNKPVIATNYSAHTEFCNNDNCFLIDIDETEPAHDGKAFYGQGRWAKISNRQIDQCIDKMRYLYKNRIDTNSEGLNTAKRLSWNNSANIISGCISI